MAQTSAATPVAEFDPRTLQKDFESCTTISLTSSKGSEANELQQRGCNRDWTDAKPIGVHPIEENGILHAEAFKFAQWWPGLIVICKMCNILGHAPELAPRRISAQVQEGTRSAFCSVALMAEHLSVIVPRQVKSLPRPLPIAPGLVEHAGPWTGQGLTRFSLRPPPRTQWPIVAPRILLRPDSSGKSTKPPENDLVNLPKSRRVRERHRSDAYRHPAESRRQSESCCRTKQHDVAGNSRANRCVVAEHTEWDCVTCTIRGSARQCP